MVKPNIKTVVIAVVALGAIGAGGTVAAQHHQAVQHQKELAAQSVAKQTAQKAEKAKEAADLRQAQIADTKRVASECERVAAALPAALRNRLAPNCSLTVPIE
jgi:uncharacterized protein HemX